MSVDGSQTHPVEALSAFLDQEIGAVERSEIESHLRSCAGCRALLEDLRRLDAAVGAEVAPPVPADLARRIRSRLGAAGVAAGPGVTSAVSAAAPSSSLRRGWSAWLGPLPLAAAASLIVVCALWLLSPYRPSAPSRSPASASEERVMARSDAAKDVAPPAPPAGEGKTSTDALQEAAPRDADAKNLERRQEVRQRVAVPEIAPAAPATEPAAKRDLAESAGAPAAHERAVAKSNQAAGAAGGGAASGAVAAMPLATGAGAWPIAIEAPPYHVVLNAEDAMVVSQGGWTCAVPIDPADGRRLARIAGSPAQGAPGGAPATPPARAVSPAAEAALDLIRGRYRAAIEERCGSPPR